MAEITELKGLEIKLLPIKLLVNNEGQIEGVPKNPRFIKDWRYKLLLQSLTESPEMLSLKELWVYKVGNIYVVIAGNMRLRGSKEKGYKSLPCKILPPETTIEKLKEYAIKDNSGYGDWEMDSLANEWESPKIVEWGVELHGWENGEVPFEESETAEAKEDDFDTTPPAVAKTVLGDLYEIGLHRVLCGDSCDSDAVAKLMNGEKADIVYTDPPYGLSYQSNMRTKTDKFEVLKNDEEFIAEWVNNIPLYSNGFVFVWTSWKVIKEWIEICSPIGELSNMIIWDKGGGGIGDLKKTFATDFEIALVYNRGSEITGKRLGSVWQINKDAASGYVHPTQKPVELAALAIENIIPINKICLDFFLGSGSTMVAAHQLKRKCFGCEISPQYCDVIVKRMLNLDSTLRVKRNGVDVTEEWRA